MTATEKDMPSDVSRILKEIANPEKIGDAAKEAQQVLADLEKGKRGRPSGIKFGQRFDSLVVLTQVMFEFVLRECEKQARIQLLGAEEAAKMGLESKFYIACRVTKKSSKNGNAYFRLRCTLCGQLVIARADQLKAGKIHCPCRHK